MKGYERLESQHDTIPIGCSAHVEASLVIHMPDYRFGALTVQVFLGEGTRESFLWLIAPTCQLIKQEVQYARRLDAK